MADPVYIADCGAVRSVPLDGLTVVYHVSSGMTHIVAPPAPEILDALGAGPADAAELLRRLGARFAFEGGEVIHARLNELEAAGLVRRA
ncbi:MAG: HPr-rel-A system PqqD family peptide chaperone [Alphaproteobacteria bacterium]|nr:MAG: HPr-rel-A system PqqD family peptide chaperone [Alphaproteobacteria bacterium]